MSARIADDPRQRGTAMPRTRRGIASPYEPPPWHLVGRAIAIWFRPRDPEEARRHLPSWFETDDDPVLGARFWELRYDDGKREGQSRLMREATVAFPVRFGTDCGDNTVHIYADDPVYILFARELMGWPVLPAMVRVSPPPTTLSSGQQVSGVLERDGDEVMRASVELNAPVPAASLPAKPPTWLTDKIIPSVAGGTQLHQVVRTGPSEVRWGEAWDATGHLTFGVSPIDELHHLTPREILSAQYWSDVELWLAPGTVLATVDSATEP